MNTLDPRALMEQTMQAIEDECRAEKLFLGTVNALAVVRKHLSAALSQPQADEPIEPLGADFEAVWDKNAAALYESDPVSPQAALAVKEPDPKLERMLAKWESAGYKHVMLPGTAMTCDTAAPMIRSALVASPPPSGEVEALRADVSELLRMIDVIQKKPRRESIYGIYHPSSPMAQQVEKIRSALSSAPATADGWRPMVDAPKDGTKFDAWVPDAFGGDRMTGLSFNQKGKLRQNGLLTEAELPRWPTHWMPLPAAPTATGGR